MKLLDLIDAEFLLGTMLSRVAHAKSLSALLRMISGLEDISSSDINIGSKRVNDVDP